MASLIARVTSVAEQQTLAAISKLQQGKAYPDATAAGGAWGTTVPGRWTCGFFPGVMWQLHSLTGKQSWAQQAQIWQAPLANKQRSWISQLDYGFIYLPSFAHSYEVTKLPGDLRQALAAAEALSWAYNPETRSVRSRRASWQGWEPARATKMYKQIVIIDFTINVLMLAWAARHVGPSNDVTLLRMDTDPAAEWRNMAIQHARQVAANHVRPDGSTYHIVEYHPDTGAINKRYTYQGLEDNSTWARGQSWAVYGMSAMYHETGEPEFLAVAQKVTDKWLDLMMTQPSPEQFVPLWDFNAAYDDSIDGPRDSSAAAIAALGMLYLSEALGPDSACGQRYLCAAVSTIRSLAGPKYLAVPDGSFAALLKHGTSNLPSGGGIDAGLIYGDFYFLQALAKCNSMEACRNH